ncbi:hypothetical protein ENT52713_15370 [Enterobacter sp. 200527-13]|uniref:hypothetical protein n=1 Tax=Enterobacter TaxID=547 RepID=UPI0022BCBF35|nr:hypothetical protein [Enterobacter sp. 200527-13]GLH24141.1 hypothetical protein ENT52713_15370 [Enterobacter sp. 200527-13]
MKERGMIFNGAMVRAILDGRKTQTRRPANPQPELTAGSGFSWKGWVYGSGSTDRETNKNFAHVACPHGKPGDRIWVRETFSCIGNEEGHPVDAEGNLCSREDAQRIYRASAIQKPRNYGIWTSPDGFDFEGAWTPSIHMPRWASRITLEITNVGVQRLQSISQNDASREGLIRLPATGRYCLNQGDQYFGGASHDAREVFSWLWESIYGKESWQANPWVWVIEFKRIEEKS